MQKCDRTILIAKRFTFIFLVRKGEEHAHSCWEHFKTNKEIGQILLISIACQDSASS